MISAVDTVDTCFGRLSGVKKNLLGTNSVISAVDTVDTCFGRLSGVKKICLEPTL